MTQSRKRILLIDLCRGILILMMTARHTISLLEISVDHWLYKYFLPQGWATVCFISLSGFTIGLLYTVRMADPYQHHQISLRLRKRSWQLMVVMFVSNIVMLISKLLVNGEVTSLINIKWWVGLLTFKTPYSISSILIPTALLVFISPVVLRSILQFKVLPIMFTLIFLSFITARITANIYDPNTIHYLLRRLLFQADGYYPILLMVLYGGISMTLGTLWQTNKVYIILLSGIVYYCLAYLAPKSVIAFITLSAISGPARLVIINFVSVILLKLKHCQIINDFLCTIGRFSLLSFLLHRVILQILSLLLYLFQPSLPIEYLFILSFVTTLGSVWLVCNSRLRYPKLNAVLKSIYI